MADVYALRNSLKGCRKPRPPQQSLNISIAPKFSKWELVSAMSGAKIDISIAKHKLTSLSLPLLFHLIKLRKCKSLFCGPSFSDGSKISTPMPRQKSRLTELERFRASQAERSMSQVSEVDNETEANIKKIVEHGDEKGERKSLDIPQPAFRRFAGPDKSRFSRKSSHGDVQSLATGEHEHSNMPAIGKLIPRPEMSAGSNAKINADRQEIRKLTLRNIYMKEPELLSNLSVHGLNKLGVKIE